MPSHHRVLVAGAGAQGNVVAGVLARAEDVAAIVLADLDPERARETAANIGSPKVTVDRVDAAALDPTTAFLRSGRFDLVVNTALPEFIPNVMMAALRAGVNYVDLSSTLLYERQGKPIEQLEHESEWRSSGRTALVNAGSAPGLTNVMAREGADQFDRVESIRIRDYSVTTSDRFEPLWSLPVFLLDCATEPMIWEDGRPKRMPIFSGEEIYDFPPPIGRPGKVYLHAHEEPVTIPLYVGKPVRHCDYKIGEPDIDAWRFLIEGLGLLDDAPVEVRGVRVSPREVLLKRLPRTIAPQRLMDLAGSGRLNSQSMVACEVDGWKDGRRGRIVLWSDSPDLRTASTIVRGTSDVSLVTSVPAATFSLMLLRGQIRQTGVVLPETLGPEERAIFYRGIGGFGIQVRRKIETGHRSDIRSGS
ncbi:MAG TPA: saccharopine dehydrogenase NADP-binding domain-containing protein [Candidatus Polarisedimenticolia bacterium]|jgi:saccharopine dehydrogenase-like NADP-dependent oxidoreductase|nr:saccharopine dehydrogenase NADP-binding domain-containing protein [Candidatus Polarisedimenticolia bacterium]